MLHRFTQSPLVNIALLAVFLWVGFAAYNIFSRSLSLYRESRKLEADIQSLQEKNRALEASIIELEVPEVIEREAKERLNLKKKGEEVVVVVPEGQNSAEEIATKEGLWERIKRVFR